MRSLRLASADLKDRVRGPQVILALLVMVVLTSLYLPAGDASYVTLRVMDFRGVYNSAWVGMVVAVLSSLVFSLPAFYLVKNALERDHRMGVWQLVLTSPIQKFTYLVSKACSNFALLTFLVVVVALTALPIQLFRAEDTQLNLAQLFLPTLLVTLPSMFLIGCVAVFFESVRGLRYGGGNVLYFFVWTLLVIPSLNVTLGVPDPFGIAPVIKDMLYAASATPDLQSVEIGANSSAGVSTFVWQGFEWNLSYVLGRLVWVVAGLALLALGAALYQPPQKAPQRASRKARSSLPWQPRSPWLTVLLAESRIALKGLHPALLLVAVGLWALGFIYPMQALPLLLVAPLLVLSRVGASAYQHHLPGVLFSTQMGERLLFFKGLAAFGISLGMCSSVLLRQLAEGQWLAALGTVCACGFTATLAVGLGALSQNHTLFEALYFAGWYLGPFNHWPVLDFTAWPLAPFALVIGLVVLCVAHLSQLARTRAGLLH